MSYFGTTQGTASWLLGKPGVLDAVHDILMDRDKTLSLVTAKEFVEGPMRLSGTESQALICAWNVEYTTGLGDDSWGFVRLDPDWGLAARPEISREVLERSLYIISQRLQSLLIDGAYIHRPWPNGSHTCLAGRGTEARQYSVGYVERDVSDGAAVLHAVMCIGPEHNLIKLASAAASRAGEMAELLPASRRLYDPARKKDVLPPGELTVLRSSLAAYIEDSPRSEYDEVNISTSDNHISERDAYRTSGWTYNDWVSEQSPVSIVQRRLIHSAALDHHPVRIIGPAGSGKTLVMQLLALRRLELAAAAHRPSRILYLVHNSKMGESVKHRFSVLQSSLSDVLTSDQTIEVNTLSEYGVRELGLTSLQVVDPDAYQAKEFQLETMSSALADAMEAHSTTVEQSHLFQEAVRDPALLTVLTRLVMEEISGTIKGNGLTVDEKRYVESQKPLSRLHGLLNPDERRVLFSAYRFYHKVTFDTYGVLDSDDVAISLLGKLRTPVWELHRRELGFDHVFVDEAQLFNENERRVLPFLTKATVPYVPVVLALDEAQELYGRSAAGLATLGIENVANESLSVVYRSSKAIVRLAFFIIQRSTDLFGPDFPDFTALARDTPSDDDPLAAPPQVEVCPADQGDYARFVLHQIRSLRKAGMRRLAVICLADQYWQAVLDELRRRDLPLHVLESRGEKLSPTAQVVVLSRPAHIGGQEFDASLLLGAEQGLTPPRVLDNDALAVAVEQQALREMYLSVTRARHRVVVALARGATLTPVLAEAAKAGVLRRAAESSSG